MALFPKNNILSAPQHQTAANLHSGAPGDCALLISPKQAAQMLAVSEATLYRWLRQRRGFPRPLKLSAGCTRFKLRELIEFIASLEAGE
jgi:predicted DNA-binding transcriptional regulator AlpA